jgi:hypothetical protein
VIAQGNDQLDDYALTNQLVLKHSAKVKATKTTPPEIGIARQAQRLEPRRGRKKATQKSNETEDEYSIASEEIGSGNFQDTHPVENKEANVVDSEEPKPNINQSIHFCPNFEEVCDAALCHGCYMELNSNTILTRNRRNCKNNIKLPFLIANLIANMRYYSIQYKESL